MANEELLSVQDGDADAALVLDMTTQAFGGGLSGFVPEGNYKLRAKGARWVTKKDLSGKNLHVTWEVVEPAEHSGVTINAYHPAPVGDQTSDKFQQDARHFQNLVASHYSGVGQLEEIRKLRNAAFRPAWLLEEGGRVVFALTGEEVYKNRKTASVAFYINAKEYVEAPGPRKGANPVVDAATLPATKAASPAAVPEMLPGSGGGNSGSSPQPLDQLLGVRG